MLPSPPTGFGLCLSSGPVSTARPTGTRASGSKRRPGRRGPALLAGLLQVLPLCADLYV